MQFKSEFEKEMGLDMISAFSTTNPPSTAKKVIPKIRPESAAVTNNPS